MIAPPVWKQHRLMLLMALLLSTFVTGGLAHDASDDERYDAQREHYDLVDREKWLAKHDDELGQAIFETKQKIKYLQDEVDAMAAEQSRVRHDLIITRVKLLH